jgi:hypothetical protein
MENYWEDIDTRLESLMINGFVKLPSLSNILNLEKIRIKIDNKSSYSNKFSESTFEHLNLNNELQIDKFLTPKLFDIANKQLFFTGKINNQYHVTRVINPGNKKEQYRTHFDSHLFTLVYPIRMPKVSVGKSSGELLFFPNARCNPKFEIINVIEKIYFKRFANEKSTNLLLINNKMLIENFENYEPLLFIGNTTLHTNKEVDKSANCNRITFLSHFFDPFQFGLGGLLRKLRFR